MTLTTSGAAVFKAGVHVSSTISTSGAALSIFLSEAEGRITIETRRDWITSYASLSTEIKNCLSDVASSLMAMKLISYDTTGYLSREADTLLNVNDEIISNGMRILKDFKSADIKTPNV